MYKGDKNKFGKEQLASMEGRKLSAHIKMPDEVKDNLQKNITKEQQLYNTFCGSCHQQNGLGAAGRFPSLAGTDWVVGDKQKLIDVVLNGLQGPIEVNMESFDGVMPKHAFLSDEDLSTILTYVRQNFGNKASAVTPEEVKEGRNKSALVQ